MAASSATVPAEPAPAPRYTAHPNQPQVLFWRDAQTRCAALEPALAAAGIVTQPASTFSSVIDALEVNADQRQSLLFIAADLPAADIGQAFTQLNAAIVAGTLLVVVCGEAVDEDEMVAALQRGAQDYIQLPASAALLAAKLAALFELASVHQLMRKSAEQLAENHDRILVEQQMAKEVFDKVARENAVPMVNIQHWLSPIATFNGDVLLAAPTPQGGMMVLLGDFTGHGLAAAIGAIPLASTFYKMVEKGFALTDIMREVNAKLYEVLPVSVFCCACAVQLNFAEGYVEICNAGLPDSYLRVEATAQLEAISSSTLPLGVVADAGASLSAQRVRLAPGDRIYLFSDGVLEAENTAGEQFGEARLCDILQRASLQFDDLQQALNAHIGEQQRGDDISLVEITMLAAQEFARMVSNDEQTLATSEESWRLQYEFRPSSLRHQDPLPLLQHILMEVPRLRRHAGSLFTVLSELYNNAVDHGLLGLDSVLKQEADGFVRFYELRQERLAALDEGFVRFSLDYQAEGESATLVVEVEDSGAGFSRDAAAGTAPGAANPHGRGIALVESLCEEFEYLGAGNQARAVLRFS